MFAGSKYPGAVEICAVSSTPDPAFAVTRSHHTFSVGTLTLDAWPVIGFSMNPYALITYTDYAGPCFLTVAHNTVRVPGLTLNTASRFRRTPNSSMPRFAVTAYPIIGVALPCNTTTSVAHSLNRIQSSSTGDCVIKCLIWRH